MEIRIRQTGGFAGTVDLGGVDTSRLGESGKRIERLVAALQSRSSAPSGNVGADLPRYEITVVDGDRVWTIEKQEEDGGDNVLRQLVAAVAGLDRAIPDGSR
jgi:hypothetical protein